MTRTGSVVTLEVAKQGAIYHGLATLLNQPSPMMQRGKQTKIILYIAITVLFMTSNGENTVIHSNLPNTTRALNQMQLNCVEWKHLFCYQEFI